MPLFQVGYRQYDGVRTNPYLRWLPITRSGVTIAWRSKLLRRLVFVSFLPFLYFGWVFFLIGRATQPIVGDETSWINENLRDLVGPSLQQQLQNDPGALREVVWAAVFALFGAHIQLLIGGLVAAVVGPPLVSTDMRSRSFLIYFARPVSRLDYIQGKAGVVIAMLAAVSLMPSLFLYTLSILFSPSLETLAQTAPIVLITIASTLGAIIPTALLVLTLSSFTTQPRFATAAWIALCTFGPLTHSILSQTVGLRDNGWTFLLSLPHTIRALQLGMYDVGGRVEAAGIGEQAADVVEGLSTTNSPALAAAWLAFVSIACLLTLLRRVDAPTRI